MKVLFRFAVLLFVSTSASADAGLDLVVLVDRSRSMSRHAAMTQPLLRMSFELLARNAEAYHVDHRLAVISFASTATIDVPFTPATAGERARVVRAIEAVPSADGETDVLGAFAAVERMFSSLPHDAARRRAIVLLTDGVPYVSGRDMDAYASDLRSHVAARLPPSTCSLDVVLLSSAKTSRHTALWHSLRRDVHHAGSATADVLAGAHAIFSRLAGTPASESTEGAQRSDFETIVVPPYLDMIVFDVFGGSPSATIAIFPPGSSRPLQDGAGGAESVRLGDVLFTLAVSRPGPGRWRVRKSQGASRIRVRSQHFFPRGVLLQPDPAAATPARARLRIAYQVLEAQRPLNELPEYPLTLAVTLAAPDGTRIGLPMERDRTLGRAAFQTVDPAHCTAPGRYWTDVRVTTIDAGGQPLEIFRDRWSGFTIVPPAEPLQAAVFSSRQSSQATDRTWVIAAIVAALLTARALRKT